ncbi:RPM1-interacting protein 4 (RIN4) family protein [Thalictrum thalictroides]|uniref:RPM1-interacting protein 4 (RIN4) family protein n=1 Tax=Thalictrum thalictroides TaxID=46969 RepID=A0A7J6VKL2_THATH|nr:RPM1-interacting protein 4 (RIN4) family protein [Thalictrum thalictroides]
MENRREKPVFTSVPQFGGWEQQAGGNTNYSMVFNQARVNRREVKKDIRRSSIGNEQELIIVHHDHDHDSSLKRKKKILTYFNCCIKA